MSLIALDWDGTVTSDQELWLQFIKLAQSRGHRVFICTARAPEQTSEIRAALPDIEIAATSGNPKMRWVDEEKGWIPHIWIDDMPELLFRSIEQ